MNISKFAASKVLPLAVCMVALLAAMPVSQALANPTTIETIHRNVTFVSTFYSQLCGFTVTRHRDETIRFHTFTDQNGNDVRGVDTYQENGYFSANGITINYSDAGPNLVTFYPDGSALFAATGLFFNVRGTTFRVAGRFYTLVDANGDVISESSTGVDQGSPDDICAALTP